MRPLSYLGRDVPLHAGTALKDCLTAVAPMVMTWQQYGEAAYNAFEKAVLGRDVASYVPDFTATIVKHYAIHAGGLRGKLPLVAAHCPQS